MVAVLLCSHTVTSEPLRKFLGDKRDFCEQLKMPPPCDVLRCCQLYLRLVSGYAFEFYGKKNVAFGCQAPFYSPTVVKGSDGLCSIAPPRLWRAILIVLEECRPFRHDFLLN